MIHRCFPQWQPGYSVGNWVLDNQHKKLLILCRYAIDSQSDETDQGVSRFLVILNDLVDYADEHLHTEEGLLRKCAYPLLEQHQDEHVEYRRQLTDFVSSARTGEINREGLNRYLANWWSGHILGSDKQYASYIQRIR